MLAGVVFGPAAAQELPGLTLEQVLEAALSGSAEMELATLRLDVREADQLTASGLFDPVAEMSVGGGRELQRALASDGTAPATIEQGRSSYRVGMAKRYRWGALVRPQVTVSRSAASALSPFATTVAAVELGITVPLLRDRGGIASRSGERTADARYAAESHAYGHSAERSVLQAVTAYWRYLSATTELSVREASASRARVLVEETTALVAVDERPAADLNHVAGNLTTKRMAVLAAEQSVAAAKRDLGLAMGLPAVDIRLLASPATPFPLWQREEIPDLTSLIALALESRDDLAAAREQARAELVQMTAARAETRPQLDLSVSAGYSGHQSGGGLGHYFSPLYRDVPGMNLSVELSYGFPVRADRSRGTLARQIALYEQALVGQEDLARSIAAEVAVAADALDRASQTVEAAVQAVEMHRATVESEQLKHRLGDATLFDVIHAQDALTSVELGEVRARVDHVTAAALLRFHTGSLVEYRDGRFTVPSGGPGSGP